MARLAVYNINDFILTQIGTLLEWTPGEIKPIFPYQSVPETNVQKPHLVYSGTNTSDPQQWWISIDEVTYVIKHNDSEKITEIVRELKDIFRRMDSTAKDINAHCDTEGLNDFEFLSCRFLGTISSRPVDEENGLLAQPFTIRYSYMEKVGRDIA